LVADLGIVGVGLVLGWSTLAPRSTGARLGLGLASVGTAAAIAALLAEAPLVVGLGALAGGIVMRAALDVILHVREQGRAR
jgi:hypothetical protein